MYGWRFGVRRYAPDRRRGMRLGRQQDDERNERRFRRLRGRWLWEQFVYLHGIRKKIEKAPSITPAMQRQIFSEVLRIEIAKIHRHINSCHHSGQPLPWIELIVGVH